MSCIFIILYYIYNRNYLNNQLYPFKYIELGFPVSFPYSHRISFHELSSLVPRLHELRLSTRLAARSHNLTVEMDSIVRSTVSFFSISSC